MKQKPLLISIILYVMIASCEKQDYTANMPLRQPFVNEAMRYLDSQVTGEILTTLRTTSPELVQYQGHPMAVRVYPTDRSTHRFILLYKKAGRFTGQWINLSDLDITQPNASAGAVSLLDLKGRLRQRYTIQESKVTEIYDAFEDRSIVLNNPSLSTPGNPQELDAFVVTPLRGSTIYYSMFWLTFQDERFPQSYLLGDENTFNSSGGTTEMAVTVEFPGPDHPIKDIKEELKCFTTDPKAIYSVTVNVNQPIPGSRDLVNLKSEHNVGHTFLTMQEQDVNGNLTIRNIGFYPMHSAKPGNSVDQSIFGEDSETPYSVSLKIPVSASEFNDIRSTLYNLQKYNYDLGEYNCTTAVISTLNTINFHLPSTLGDNGIFKGNDPADLGEDIRHMNLDEFSVKNGGRKLIRGLSTTNSQFSPKKVGICK